MCVDQRQGEPISVLCVGAASGDYIRRGGTVKVNHTADDTVVVDSSSLQSQNREIIEVQSLLEVIHTFLVCFSSYWYTGRRFSFFVYIWLHHHHHLLLAEDGGKRGAGVSTK